MKLNCVVVDDSSIQRMIIAKLVNNHPNLHLIGDFSNAIEAKNCMSVHTVDLIFLDIEMPDGTGFDLLQRLGAPPACMVVFITAHNKYAITAIHFGALDYLLKPVSVEALDYCLNRVREKRNEGMIIEQIKHAFESYQQLQQKKMPTRMLVSTLEGIHYIPVADIVRLEAQQNATEIFYTGAKKRLIASMNIGAYEEQFEPYSSFMRVHRAHLVNLLMVDTYVRGDANLLMKDGSRVAVSRENRDELLKRLREI